MVLKRMAAFLLPLLLQVSGFGKDMEVNAGPFAYFGLTLPAEMVAGKSYQVTLRAYDSYGNITDYFGKRSDAFALHATGGMKVVPDRVTGSMFSNGSVALTLSDRVAEAVTLDITEGGRTLMVKNERSDRFVTFFDLDVMSAPLADFVLKVPKAPLAGESFDVTVTARDSQGNVIADYGNVGRGVRVRVEGKSGKRDYTVPPHAFSGGSASVALRYDIPETVRITARDLGNSAVEGSVGAVALRAQQLDRIEVRTPASIRAGERFRVELRAYNQFGRPMRNYAAVGSDVMLTGNGGGRLIPDRVPASLFFDGVAFFETRYTKSEGVDISAHPVGGMPARRSEVRETPAEAKKPPETRKPAGNEEFPLSLRFSSSLGAIEKVIVGRAERGEDARVIVYFPKKGRVREVNAFDKAIKVNGRTIGTLSVDGYVDLQGRLVIALKKSEPFDIAVDAEGSTLDLRFTLPH
jgi:hypothetical protein